MTMHGLYVNVWRSEYVLVVLACVFNTALFYPVFEARNNYGGTALQNQPFTPYYDDYSVLGNDNRARDYETAEDYAQLSDLATQLADMYSNGELDANQLYEFLYPEKQDQGTKLYDLPYSDYFSGGSSPQVTSHKSRSGSDISNILMTLLSAMPTDPEVFPSENNIEKKSDQKKEVQTVSPVSDKTTMTTTAASTTSTPTAIPAVTKEFVGQKEFPIYRPSGQSRPFLNHDEDIIDQLRSLAAKSKITSKLSKRFVSTEDELTRQISNLKKNKE